ncbi:dTDP-4-dehydrorhamnose 3,5-epimerase [Subsaxibacter sp. CAU 1640]|uniref:dTDP-4-dehydrorhamnose 3,5-epimerase n=1 Tax=Subsaxibacter sp. CAU 1640 TaxID=2933271 RepID=UPI0020029FBB|nr:dTDP-4-dehydrorhamnose 3,5-epimerase [Subsaxibacter sp. CAU 1640]MCK7589516.1 dTDP-4-dehydrorhamnose 3,5-epimerase [Subsaxibacter sp. CAU 1640]
MIATETNLQGCFVLEPRVFDDQRGYFFESFNQKTFNELIGQNISFVQDNESSSTKGVLRGLHFQKGEHAQAKLVRVIKGKVLDVVVDLRKDSKTYGQQFSLELSEANKKQLFVPKGFAHGFIVLSDSAIFSYKCDNYYNKESEGGIIYNDKTLNIDWQLPEESYIISSKDLELPPFENLII